MHGDGTVVFTVSAQPVPKMAYAAVYDRSKDTLDASLRCVPAEKNEARDSLGLRIACDVVIDLNVFRFPPRHRCDGETEQAQD